MFLRATVLDCVFDPTHAIEHVLLDQIQFARCVAWPLGGYLLVVLVLRLFSYCFLFKVYYYYGWLSNLGRISKFKII